MLQSIVQFAGGIGLFLLGMRLLTDGLKIAAGPALRELLNRATRSQWRAFTSGALITALVQSSAAVIVATIGFVNAGLMSLAQAVGLIFGANVGTTLTSWIVALVGFDVDLQALGLPAIAGGMAIWVLAVGRRAAFGQAIVGIGIFFLGLDVLKDAFVGVDGGLEQLLDHSGGAMRILLFALVGVLLTVLMQSSSAALAVTLTAAAGGVLPLPAAAAMVIGANLGTTSTAIFATIGATAAARRVAAAHVVFNLIVTVVALPLLPWLLEASQWSAARVGGAPGPATVLAVLHTFANLLGVLLVWPMTGQLVRLLESRFTTREADPGQPQFLDRHVLGTPRLALDAMRMELDRIGDIAHRLARQALNSETGSDDRLTVEQATLERLGEAVIDFAGAVNSGGDAGVDAALPSAVRVVQYYRGIAERAIELARITPVADPPPALAAQLLALRQAADRALQSSDPAVGEAADPGEVEASLQAFESVYQQTKGELLRSGSRAELSPAALVRALDRGSALRRIVGQAAKAARFMRDLQPARTT